MENKATYSIRFHTGEEYTLSRPVSAHNAIRPQLQWSQTLIPANRKSRTEP